MEIENIVDLDTDIYSVLMLRLVNKGTSTNKIIFFFVIMYFSVT